VGDFEPPGGAVDQGVSDEGLGGHEGGEGVEIYGVDAAVDDEVADDAEEDENVHAGVEKCRGQDAGWEAAKAGGGERAGGDEQQAAMVFGPGAPVDAEGERDGEAHHVEQRNDEEGLRVGSVKLHGVEMGHGDGGGDAYEGDGDAEGYSEPAGLFVDADVAGANEQGLKNIEDEPAGENERMEIEDGGTRRSWVDEIFVYRVAEAVDDGRGDEQRHEEIEVIVERRGGFGGAFWKWTSGDVNWL